MDGRWNGLRDVVGSLVSLVSGCCGPRYPWVMAGAHSTASFPAGGRALANWSATPITLATSLALPGYALACITTPPPFSTSMFKLCPSSNSVPTSGVLPVASASISLGRPSQSTVTK